MLTTGINIVGALKGNFPKGIRTSPSSLTRLLESESTGRKFTTSTILILIFYC